jgi:hypothetical protein
LDGFFLTTADYVSAFCIRGVGISLFLANGLGVLLLPKKTFLENHFCFTKGDTTVCPPMFLHGPFYCLAQRGLFGWLI